jgi:hypothetical protein
MREGRHHGIGVYVWWHYLLTDGESRLKQQGFSWDLTFGYAAGRWEGCVWVVVLERVFGWKGFGSGWQYMSKVGHISSSETGLTEFGGWAERETEAETRAE